MTIKLPWPPQELSPNARVHWATKARVAKKYRADCAVLVRLARKLPPPIPVPILVTFYPPSRRKMDRDNLIASFKSAQDGIADAIGIDDSNFLVTYAPMGEPVKGGVVAVRIGQ